MNPLSEVEVIWGDEVAQRLPLFGFCRALLRWLFLDPSSEAPQQEGVDVVLVD